MSTFFSEKQQKPQQILKPLVYNVQTSCKQVNFSDAYFPKIDFWMKISKSSLKQLLGVRKRIYGFLKKELKPVDDGELVKEFISKF